MGSPLERGVPNGRGGSGFLFAGWIHRWMGVDPNINRPRHRPGVFPDCFFRIAQKVNSNRLERLLTNGIAVGLEEMRATIDFHGKIQFGRIEIHDEVADGFLAVKIISAPLALIQMPPEEDFPQCAMIAQLASELL